MALLKDRNGRGGDLPVGSYASAGSLYRAPAILCEDRELRPHLKRPWFRAYVASRLGAELASGVGPQGLAAIPDAAFAKHSFLVGSTGSGKTRLLYHLVTGQLARGLSAVVIDPKGETADLLLSYAIASGMDPAAVTLLDPCNAAGIPGWNPLASDIPLAQAAGDLVSLVGQSVSSSAPRLLDMLTNGLLVVGSHRLSLFELARFLALPEYQEQLLRRSVRPADPVAFEEARQYFLHEFGAWGKSERSGAISPVLNKIRELLRSGYLRALLCAERNTLDLVRLWRKPGLILVKLDRTALGEEGARLLGGLLIHLLYRTALRLPGPIPVLLVLDELPVLERLVKSALSEIVTVARSQRLRLIVAAQHLGQLSDELREALLANCAVQGYFRLGYHDARLVASSLAAGYEPTVARVALKLDGTDRSTDEPYRAIWSHPIRDGHGQPVHMEDYAWKSIAGRGTSARQLARLCDYCHADGVRLYVKAADSGEPVPVEEYVRELNSEEYLITGPALQLTVSFPKPRVTSRERFGESDAVRSWTKCLQELPPRHLVLRVAEGETGVVRVQDVNPPRVPPLRRRLFLLESIAANGQTAAQIAATLQRRQEGIERITRGQDSKRERRRPKPEVDDGSLF